MKKLLVVLPLVALPFLAGAESLEDVFKSDKELCVERQIESGETNMSFIENYCTAESNIKRTNRRLSSLRSENRRLENGTSQRISDCVAAELAETTVTTQTVTIDGVTQQSVIETNTVSPRRRQQAERGCTAQVIVDVAFEIAANNKEIDELEADLEGYIADKQSALDNK